MNVMEVNSTFENYPKNHTATFAGQKYSDVPARYTSSDCYRH